jgi:molybdopterin/thiamine biosynthesis adenylyltransferase
MHQPGSRYSRQIRFGPIGEAGQNCLEKASVLICGCGALGTTIAERLARAGVGRMRIVDRDWVEESNLQRQALFTQQDADQSKPKAVAAAEAIRSINPTVEVESVVEDMHFENMASLAEGCDLLLDGTDNFETRFLINDYCIQESKPWVHGGCLGASGQGLTIRPGRSACFRCLVPELPDRDAMETCDSAGVLGSAIGLVASWQSGEALKLLSGNADQVCDGLWVMDSWTNDFRIVKLRQNPNCKCCVHKELPFLSGDIRTQVTVLCGKNAVQIDSPGVSRVALSEIADRMSAVGDVQQNAYFVRVRMPEHTLTLFRGGRTVVEGTTNEAEAKAISTRLLGG